MLLPRFDPPGYLTDFDRIPGQMDAWSRAVSGWFDGNIADVREKLGSGGSPQFYNPTTFDAGDHPIDQVIGWSGFPGTLRNRWGRATALDLADQMLPLTRRMDGPGSYYVGRRWESLFYRPQDEYCEWRVARDAQGRIVSVTFTSEPPEYWQALHGDTLPDTDDEPAYDFPGDPGLLLELYREYVSPEVQPQDLVCQEDFVSESDPRKPTVVYRKGCYNPYNRWNTTGGIMHLTQPANSLSAEITLGAMATIVRRIDGRRVVDPDALIACAAYGGLNRASDPTIGSTVNELAALGAYVTLRNPVGLAMHHMDLAGIETPSGEPIDPSFFTVLRGDPSRGLIERAVFAVPDGEGYTVSDLTIGGLPLTHGGQLAERVVVNIVGRAAGLGTLTNPAVAGRASAWQGHLQGNWLSYGSAGQPAEPVASVAFDYPPATPADPAGDAVAVSDAPARPHRHRPTRRA